MLERHGELEVQLAKKSKQVPYTLSLPEEGSTAPSSIGALLLPGGNGGKDSGHLPRLAETCAASGLPCIRITTDGSSDPKQRLNVVKAVLAKTHTLPGLEGIKRWIVMGHSVGSRVACALASQEPEKVIGVALFSFPLLKGNPKTVEEKEQLLKGVVQPMLLIRGTADSDCKLSDAILEGLSSRSWRQTTMLGGNHSLIIAGKANEDASAKALDAVCADLERWLREQQQQQNAQLPSTTPGPSSATNQEQAGSQPATLPGGSKKRQPEPAVEESGKGKRRLAE